MYGMKDRLVDPRLTEFTYKQICAYDQWAFGCQTFTEWVVDWCNLALYLGKLPDFKEFDTDSEVGSCRCSEDWCSWNAERVLARVKRMNIWEEMEKLLSPVCNRTPATFTADGGVEVKGVKYAYLAGLPYLYANERKVLAKTFPNGYVVWSKHDNEHVLCLPDGSYELLEVK